MYVLIEVYISGRPWPTAIIKSEDLNVIRLPLTSAAVRSKSFDVLIVVTFTPILCRSNV